MLKTSRRRSAEPILINAEPRPRWPRLARAKTTKVSGLRLEELAGAFGPVALFAGRRLRRRKLPFAAGAGVAAVAAVGAGVAIGVLLSRKLKARAAARAAVKQAEAAPLPAETARPPVTAGLDL